MFSHTGPSPFLSQEDSKTVVFTSEQPFSPAPIFEDSNEAFKHLRKLTSTFSKSQKVTSVHIDKSSDQFESWTPETSTLDLIDMKGDADNQTNFAADPNHGAKREGEEHVDNTKHLNGDNTKQLDADSSKHLDADNTKQRDAHSISLGYSDLQNEQIKNSVDIPWPTPVGDADATGRRVSGGDKHCSNLTQLQTPAAIINDNNENLKCNLPSNKLTSDENVDQNVSAQVATTPLINKTAKGFDITNELVSLAKTESQIEAVKSSTVELYFVSSGEDEAVDKKSTTEVVKSASSFVTSDFSPFPSSTVYSKCSVVYSTSPTLISTTSALSTSTPKPTSSPSVQGASENSQSLAGCLLKSIQISNNIYSEDGYVRNFAEQLSPTPESRSNKSLESSAVIEPLSDVLVEEEPKLENISYNRVTLANLEPLIQDERKVLSQQVITSKKSTDSCRRSQQISSVKSKKKTRKQKRNTKPPVPILPNLVQKDTIDLTQAILPKDTIDIRRSIAKQKNQLQDSDLNNPTKQPVPILPNLVAKDPINIEQSIASEPPTSVGVKPEQKQNNPPQNFDSNNPTNLYVSTDNSKCTLSMQLSPSLSIETIFQTSTCSSKTAVTNTCSKPQQTVSSLDSGAQVTAETSNGKNMVSPSANSASARFRVSDINITAKHTEIGEESQPDIDHLRVFLSDSPQISQTDYVKNVINHKRKKVYDWEKLEKEMEKTNDDIHEKKNHKNLPKSPSKSKTKKEKKKQLTMDRWTKGKQGESLSDSPKKTKSKKLNTSEGRNTQKTSSGDDKTPSINKGRNPAIKESINKVVKTRNQSRSPSKSSKLTNGDQTNSCVTSVSECLNEESSSEGNWRLTKSIGVINTSSSPDYTYDSSEDFCDASADITLERSQFEVSPIKRKGDSTSPCRPPGQKRQTERSRKQSQSPGKAGLDKDKRNRTKSPTINSPKKKESNNESLDSEQTSAEPKRLRNKSPFTNESGKFLCIFLYFYLS